MTEAENPGDEESSTEDEQSNAESNVAPSAESPSRPSLAQMYEEQQDAFLREMGNAVTLLASLPLPPLQASQRSLLLNKLSIAGETIPSSTELVELGALLGDIMSGVDADFLDLDARETLASIREQYGRINRHLTELQILRIHQQTERQRLSHANAQKAERKLEGQFAEDYDRERGSASSLRVLAFVLLFLTVGVAVWNAATLHHLSWQGELAHLAITLPLLGGAYYASYESRDHRRYARNGLGWQTRMNSFDDFCSPLPENLRNEVRTAFAKRLYSDPPDFGSSQSLAEASQNALDQALAIIRAVRNGDTAST